MTIVIPVRVDSRERKENLFALLDYVAPLRCRVIVLEADSQPRLGDKLGGKVEYVYVQDENPRFHRTRYINVLLGMAMTDVVAVWDTDALVGYVQIAESIESIRRGCTLAYPYDGQFVMLSREFSKGVRNSVDFAYLASLRMAPFLGRKLCGGVYLVHRERYACCGGENELFTGWGPEDAERKHRVLNLGHTVFRCSHGQLYHLYHPRGKNSSFYSKDDATALRKELVKVCGMSGAETRRYVVGLVGEGLMIPCGQCGEEGSL